MDLVFTYNVDSVQFAAAKSWVCPDIRSNSRTNVLYGYVIHASE